MQTSRLKEARQSGYDEVIIASFTQLTVPVLHEVESAERQI